MIYNEARGCEDLEIEIKDIRKKDYKKAIMFALKGMSCDWYIDNKWELKAYGKYFWYMELNRATQIFAAYNRRQIRRSTAG